MNDTQTTNEATSTNATPNAATPNTAETLVASLRDAGAAWARYGLRVGKLALETSAVTLQHTAKALDALAAGFEKKRDESTTTPQA